MIKTHTADAETLDSATARLFISYSRRDQDVARRLCDALAARGRALWVDWEGIPPSAEWLAEIEQGIRSADAFVFMLSPDSLRSEVCGQELAVALALNKRLVPLVVREAGETPIPPELAQRNWIFLRATDDFDSGLAALIEAVDTDLDWLHRHTALLVPALAWQGAGGERSRLLKGRALQQAEAWLAGSADKSPAAAQVQIEFIQASRRAATRRLRIALAGALVGMLTLVALAVWALIAETRADAARQNAEARRIGSDASLVASERAGLIETGALLAIESWKRRPALGNDVPLRRALRLLPEPAGGLHLPFKAIVDAVFVSDAGLVAYAAGETVGLLAPGQAGAPLKLSHDSPIIALAGCPRTQRLAARLQDGRVFLWNASSGERLANLPLRAPTTALTCSPDGTLLAIGDAGGGVAIFSTANGALVDTLPSVVNSAVRALRFDGDGKRLAAGGKSLLQVWQLAGARPIAAIAHRQPVVDIDFDPAGGRIVSASDSAAYLWSLPAGKSLKRIGQRTNVHRARFDRHGKRLVLAAGDGVVSVWDATTYERQLDVRHQGPVMHARFSPDGDYVLSASNDGTARLWRVSDGTEQLRFAHDHFLSAARFSPDGVHVLTAGRDGRVRLWHNRIPDRELLPKPYGNRVSRDAQSLLEATGQGRWQLRRLDSADPPFAFSSGAGVLTFDVSADRRQLAVSRFDAKVDIWSIPEATMRQQLTLAKPADTVGFHPDGARLLTGARDGSVRLWSLADGKEIWQRVDGERFVMTHAFSADGRQVASGGSDRLARVWAVGDGRIIHTLKHNHDVRGLAFSPDGSTLASASSDRMARLWRLDTGQVARYLEHQFPVLAVAYDASGTLIATGAADHTARLWDAASGVERSRIDTPDAVLALGFQADGRLRVHTGSESSIHTTDGQTLVSTACQRLTRNLGLIAWAQYIGKEPPQATCPGLPPPAL